MILFDCAAESFQNFPAVNRRLKPDDLHTKTALPPILRHRDTPDPPFELWASDGTHAGYVRIEWGFEGDYSYFDLWRKRDGEAYEWAHLANTEGLGWSDDDLDIGVVYWYKVRAIVGETETEFSNHDSGWAGDGV